MYRSLTSPDGQEEEKNQLLKIGTDIINIALKRGITLKRWCLVHNILLEKDLTDPKLRRLRIIHIIEAAYNLATKILWTRRLMRKAEKEKLLTDSIWGSRKGRNTQDAATAKELHYDITHLSFSEYATMENDAKSCYDRMVPGLIMLISRSSDLSKTPAKSVGSAFEKTKHHIATKNGRPRRSFGFTKGKPIFGSWQGATKSVVNWVLLISTLQKIHQDLVRDATFESTNERTMIIQSTIGFVDDNINCVTKESMNLITQTLLFSSGGTLELNKCSTYIIKWEQDKEGKHKICDNLDHINII